jgi:hypothetical protein
MSLHLYCLKNIKIICGIEGKVVPLQPQSEYCAGFYAINTLKKSDLAFNCEEESVSLKWLVCVEISKMPL